VVRDFLPSLGERAERDIPLTGKTGRSMEIPLASPLPAHVQTMPTSDDPAAPRELGETSFHSLRHTTTSLLKNAGVSEAVAMDIIGHDTEAISRILTKIADDDVAS
jgi:hypothetical protein